MSRHRPYLVWGGVSVALALVVSLLVVPWDAFVALDVRRSSLRTTPDGIAAWARSLESLGVDVEQRFEDLVTRPPTGAVLVLLEPVIAPSAGEVHELLEWVRGGGMAVYSPRFDDELTDSVGVWVDAVQRDFDDPTSADSLLEHPWTDEAVGWQTPSPWHLRADSARVETWVPLSRFADTELPSVAWVPVGEGGVLLLADGGVLSNAVILDDPSAITVTRAVVDRSSSGAVWFSEYHQGVDGARSVLREALSIAWGGPLGRALLCVALAALALLVLSGRRFGRPLPDPPRKRRSTVEHVEALAGIYRASKAGGTVAHYLVRSALRRMHLPPSPLSDADLISAWAARNELREPALAAASALSADPPDLPVLEASLDDVVRSHHERLNPS